MAWNCEYNKNDPVLMNLGVPDPKGSLNLRKFSTLTQTFSEYLLIRRVLWHLFCRFEPI